MAKKTKADLEAEIAELRSMRPPALEDGSDAGHGWKAERFGVLLEAQRPILNAMRGRYLKAGETPAEGAARTILERDELVTQTRQLKNEIDQLDREKQAAHDALAKADWQHEEWCAALTRDHEAEIAAATEEIERLRSRSPSEDVVRALALATRQADRAEARARFRGWVLLLLTLALMGAAAAQGAL